MSTESDEKASQLAVLLRANGLEKLVLTQSENIAWLLPVRSHVSTTGAPCFMAVVTFEQEAWSLEIITSHNEVERLEQVEFANCVTNARVKFRTIDWFTPLLAAAPTGPKVGGDTELPGVHNIADQLATVRLVLSNEQQARLARLTSCASRAVESVARGVRPGETEHEIAGRTATALIRLGLEPIVLLVGSGDALMTHRHPLPRNVLIRDRCMISVGVRRQGLFSSVTRYVCFGAVDGELGDSFHRLLGVEAALLNASRPGEKLTEALAAGRAEYERQGFGQCAWRHHHQGGLGGFNAREVIAGRDPDVELAPGMVVAWNPGAAGWKVEDVAIINAHDCLPLGSTGRQWPTVQVAGRSRAGFLIH